MAPEPTRPVPESALLKSFVDIAPLPTFLLDPSGAILQWNAAAAAVFGWTAAEVIGRPNPIIPPEKLSEFRDHMSKVLRGEDISGMELRRRRKDGAPIDITLWTAAIRDAGGGVSAVLAVCHDITARKRAEAERLRQAALLKSQQEASPDGILVVDEEGAILSFNRRFVEMWGIPEEVIASQSDERAIQSILEKLSDPEAFVKRVMHLYRHREERSYELIGLKDGRTFERHSAPIFGEEGRYHGRVWYFRDITEHRRVQEELRMKSGLLEAQIEAAPDGIVLGDDRTGMIISSNRRFAEMWGIPPEVLATKSTKRAVEAALDKMADPRGFMDLLGENIQRPEETAHGEITLKDGRTFERNSAPVRGPGGEEFGRVVHYRDITDRKRAEEELRKQTRLLQTIVDNMAEGVVVVDAAGRILLVNRAAERIVGLGSAEVTRALESPEALRGLSDRVALFMSDGLTRLVPQGVPILRALAGEEINEAELLLRSQDPPRVAFLSCNARPIRDESGGIKGAVCVFRDVTERKRAAEAEALREREAMQRDFISNVSHEFRTPVAAIKGFAETLVLGGLEDAKHRLKFAKTIERHANRLARLVEDLLDLASLESGKRPPYPEPLELAGFAAEAVAAISPLAKRNGLDFQVEVEPSLRVRADRSHLEQILQHLFENAIKFNRRGGRVRLEGRASDGAALVTVRDDGPGIAPADLPHIFERFYRSDKALPRKHGGTGLGLSIVRQAVEANGGRIWVESAEGRGSAFHFTLPLA